MTASAKISAGLLMYSTAESELRVFLAHPGGPYFTNKDEGYWGIPKGEIEAGEDLLEVAVREFAEETGIMPIGPYIELGYIYLKSGKRVHAWAFAGEWPENSILVSNTFELEWPPKSGRIQTYPEIDRAGMFTASEAQVKMSPAQFPFVLRLEKRLKQS